MVVVLAENQSYSNRLVYNCPGNIMFSVHFLARLIFAILVVSTLLTYLYNSGSSCPSKKEFVIFPTMLFHTAVRAHKFNGPPILCWMLHATSPSAAARILSPRSTMDASKPFASLSLTCLHDRVSCGWQPEVQDVCWPQELEKQGTGAETMRSDSALRKAKKEVSP